MRRASALLVITSSPEGLRYGREADFFIVLTSTGDRVRSVTAQ
jgi:hypothetical protein